jgi:hypothetical protein
MVGAAVWVDEWDVFCIEWSFIAVLAGGKSKYGVRALSWRQMEGDKSNSLNRVGNKRV